LNHINIGERFVRLSWRWPDRTAIVSPSLTLSYREIVARAARSARELRSVGIGLGSNVGIATRDSGEAIVLMISLWMLGAVPVPIDFRTKAAERAMLTDEFNLIAILEDRQPPGVFGYPSILVDDSWTDILARHDGSPTFENGQPATALISLTSGTTGRPLGVVLDHEQLLFRLLSNLQLGRKRSGGRLLNPLPISSSSSRNHSLSQLLNGGTAFFYPPLFGPDKLAEAALSKGATIMCVVPTILRGLFELPRDRGSPLFDRLDLFYCFGAPVLPDEKRRARAELCANFVQGYSSNISGRISVLHGTDIDARPETVGRVFPHVELQIVDDHDQPLPFGVSGIIRVRSPAMALKTYGAMIRADGDRIKDGWVYPGDIGAVDETGFLCLLGRTSDVIIRGGFNVHPCEVEIIIAEHEAVRDVAVVGFSKSREGEEIAAFVVSRGDLTEADLVGHCRARLTPDKRPRKFVFVNELPRNTNGKIIRAKLRHELESAV
jgi:acyl-CoA synthetase (AMP-forming)/AMP-acid ligase II